MKRGRPGLPARTSGGSRCSIGKNTWLLEAWNSAGAEVGRKSPCRKWREAGPWCPSALCYLFESRGGRKAEEGLKDVGKKGVNGSLDVSSNSPSGNAEI